MPNIASAKKRVRVTKRKTMRNKIIKSNLKTIFKSALVAIEEKKEDAYEKLKRAVERIDKAAAKGVIHKNKAAHKKSRLQCLFNSAN